jgi:hypothetical protein
VLLEAILDFRLLWTFWLIGWFFRGFSKKKSWAELFVWNCCENWTDVVMAHSGLYTIFQISIFHINAGTFQYVTSRFFLSLTQQPHTHLFPPSLSLSVPENCKMQQQLGAAANWELSDKSYWERMHGIKKLVRGRFRKMCNWHDEWSSFMRKLRDNEVATWDLIVTDILTFEIRFVFSRKDGAEISKETIKFWNNR